MKAREIAEKFLIKKVKTNGREIILKNRMHIFEGLKTAFNIQDDTELTEKEFKEMLDKFLESESYQIPKYEVKKK